jgi:hypothetical protein
MAPMADSAQQVRPETHGGGVVNIGRQRAIDLHWTFRLFCCALVGFALGWTGFLVFTSVLLCMDTFSLWLNRGEDNE